MVKRESIGTLILTDDDNATRSMHSMETDNVPSFIQEDSEAYLKYMSPPRTTRVYKVELITNLYCSH